MSQFVSNTVMVAADVASWAGFSAHRLVEKFAPSAEPHLAAQTLFHVAIAAPRDALPDVLEQFADANLRAATQISPISGATDPQPALRRANELADSTRGDLSECGILSFLDIAAKTDNHGSNFEVLSQFLRPKIDVLEVTSPTVKKMHAIWDTVVASRMTNITPETFAETFDTLTSLRHSKELAPKAEAFLSKKADIAALMEEKFPGIPLYKEPAIKENPLSAAYRANELGYTLVS